MKRLLQRRYSDNVNGETQVTSRFTSELALSVETDIPFPGLHHLITLKIKSKDENNEAVHINLSQEKSMPIRERENEIIT